ncbi:hypothetical protein PENSPDRAFT_683159 [Peniophora sp. CONT]|nr:hypothetical protein PENSPDRAFT_683159 [Peniophora sp. CONT]
MAPQDVYETELFRAFPARGYPIYNPQRIMDETGSLAPPVSVGDVGYISRRNGNFIRMFNAHEEPGENAQPGLHDLPEHFEVFPRRPVGHIQNHWPIFHSASVSVVGADIGVSGYASNIYLNEMTGQLLDRGQLQLSGDAGVSFESSSDRGAILVTPDPIICYDTEAIDFYKKYARKHLEHWHAFATDRLGLEISLEDIVFVTGVDRTTSWGTLVWSGSSLQVGFNLQVQYASVGPKLATHIKWSRTQGAFFNYGPPRRAADNDAHTSLVHNDASDQRPINDNADQSIFIRYVRAATRGKFFRGIKMVAGAKPKDLKRHDDDADFPSGSIDVEDEDDIMIESIPERTPFQDSLEPVFDRLLESNPHLRFAIAHHEDLTLLDEPRRHSESDIYRIDVVDGVGMMLRSRSQKEDLEEPFMDEHGALEQLLRDLHHTPRASSSFRRDYRCRGSDHASSYFKHTLSFDLWIHTS